VVFAAATAEAAGAPESRLRTVPVCIGGRTVEAPPVTPEARGEMEARLAEARAEFEKNPKEPEAFIWLGRRTAYLGRFGEAIGIYTRGLRRHPHSAKLYRHRGHRYITLRCFDLAIRDLERAAKLIAGRPDEVEPDGLPNARNTPTSTLNSNVWYHLGLAYYLKGDFKNALRCYRQCLRFSKNPDMLTATTHWLYMTLRRLERMEEARVYLRPINAGMDIIENRDYHRLLLMYRGEAAPDALLKEASGQEGSALSSATIGYGVGNWYLYNKQPERALRTFLRMMEGAQQTSFGYIAAEAELERAGLKDYPRKLPPKRTIDE
jgi:tetratricopeptide (TPR) repeat protein